jgi:DNA polymerase II large subunit
MDSGVLTAILAFVGSALASFAGIMTSARVTTYRLQQLEKKVEAHNNLICRTYELEAYREVSEEKFKVANHRIEDLENQERKKE